MQIFIRKPHLDLFSGVRVEKDTVLEYKNESVEQHLENLVLHSVSKVSGEGYESVYDTTIYLKEGDVLIFSNGLYHADEAATAERRAGIRNKLKQLLQHK